MPIFTMTWGWLPAPPRDTAFGPDAAAWGRLRIEIDGINVTAHHDADTSQPAVTRDSVIGGMASLADWIVENWLSIFWESHTPFAKIVANQEDVARVPSLNDGLDGFVRFAASGASPDRLARWQHRHSLGHGASDLALPSLVFLPEERTVGLVVEQPPLALEPNVRFERGSPEGRGWPRDPVWVPKDELEGTLAGFVMDVIERIRATEADARSAEWLERRFNEVRHNSRDPSVRRRMLLGETVQRAWDDCQVRLGPNISALENMLLDSELIEDASYLDTLVGAVERRLDQPTATEQAWRVFPRVDGEGLLPPYLRGYRLAIRARERLNQPKEPLVNLRATVQEFGVSVDAFDGPPIFRSAAIAPANGGATILQNKSDSVYTGVAPTRFALAAALGRLLIEGALHSGPVGIAHGPQSRWLRTQEANAFAAEFLLPKTALEESTDISFLCDTYGISRSAAERHRQNRLRDELH